MQSRSPAWLQSLLVLLALTTLRLVNNITIIRVCLLLWLLPGSLAMQAEQGGLEVGGNGQIGDVIGALLLPVGFTILSLNCRGLRGRQGTGAGTAASIRRREQLAAILHDEAPTIAVIQETWLKPHENRVDIEGYRYFGRSRLSRLGRATASGGVGILVSTQIPRDRVRRLPDEDEAGSHGTMYIDIETSDGAHIVVGSIYSECAQTVRAQQLDMALVWAARARRLRALLSDASPRPLFLLGGFNAHLGVFQELPASPRLALGQPPTAARVAQAAPLRELLTDLPLAVLNGRFGAVTPTCFPSAEAAHRPTREQLRRGSVIDLALVSSLHLPTHVEGFTVTPTRRPFEDHRMLLVRARTTSNLEDTNSTMHGHSSASPLRRSPLRLPRTVGMTVLRDLHAATNWWASNWERQHGDVIQQQQLPQHQMDSMYSSFASTLREVLISVLGTETPRQQRTEALLSHHRSRLRQARRHERGHPYSRETATRNSSRDHTQRIQAVQGSRREDDRRANFTELDTALSQFFTGQKAGDSCGEETAKPATPTANTTCP